MMVTTTIEDVTIPICHLDGIDPESHLVRLLVEHRWSWDDRDPSAYADAIRTCLKRSTIRGYACLSLYDDENRLDLHHLAEALVRARIPHHYSMATRYSYGGLGSHAQAIFDGHRHWGCPGMSEHHTVTVILGTGEPRPNMVHLFRALHVEGAWRQLLGIWPNQGDSCSREIHPQRE